jgi:hypothetical protein
MRLGEVPRPGYLHACGDDSAKPVAGRPHDPARVDGLDQPGDLGRHLGERPRLVQTGPSGIRLVGAHDERDERWAGRLPTRLVSQWNRPSD